MKNLPLVHQLFVGDAKMGSIETRARIHGKDHYYLLPLSKKQCSTDQLAKYLEQRPEKLLEISSVQKDDTVKIKAKAFELTQVVSCDEFGFPWLERRLVVFSPAYAKRQKQALEDRLLKAIDQLNLLLQAKQGRKKLTNLIQVQQAVKQILSTHKVKDLLSVQIKEQIETKQIRAYLDRPARTEKSTSYELEYK